MPEHELHSLVDQIRAARALGQALDIQGAGSKSFYGQPPCGRALDTRPFSGIASYQPTELVVTVRCGTPLRELETVLEASGQCLPFEPPRFAGGGTVGGMVACGLSGPARASSGSLRDHVLGVTLLNGDGQLLRFGGEVMKNVAGYDVSRLLAGSMGTLGVIVEVSLKVLPMAPASATLRLACDQPTALAWLNQWGGQPLPLNASAWFDGALLVRLRGAAAAVQASTLLLQHRHGAEHIEAPQSELLWQGLRDHTHDYFQQAGAALGHGEALWRLSVPQTAAPLPLAGMQLIEWHGGQRWCRTAEAASQVRQAAARVGGHATLFRGRNSAVEAFAPLPAPLARIHRQLKASFDPAGIFNRGRLYAGL